MCRATPSPRCHRRHVHQHIATKLVAVTNTFPPDGVGVLEAPLVLVVLCENEKITKQRICAIFEKFRVFEQLRNLPPPGIFGIFDRHARSTQCWSRRIKTWCRFFFHLWTTPVHAIQTLGDQNTKSSKFLLYTVCHCFNLASMQVPDEH